MTATSPNASVQDLADRYAVAGHPVAHSRSPFIHGRFAELTGQRLDYGRLLCPLEGFEATVRAFAASSLTGYGPARGCNVTVPFKFEALSLAAQLTPRAALAQAANTLRFDPAAAGGWQADNTDGVGLVRDITQHAGVDLRGASVLLIGAGGAAAGALGPLIEARPQRLVLANRTAAKADALCERHASLATRHEVSLGTVPLDDCGRAHDVVINATASSLGGEAVPVSGASLRAGGLALDMMYGPAAVPFLSWARSHGAHARDGLGMLVEQAAEAFWFWRAVRPPTAEVLRELRARVEAGAA